MENDIEDLYHKFMNDSSIPNAVSLIEIVKRKTVLQELDKSPLKERLLTSGLRLFENIDLFYSYLFSYPWSLGGGKMPVELIGTPEEAERIIDQLDGLEFGNVS